MRLQNLIFIALVFSLFLVSSGFTTQSAEQLFHSAQYEEKVTGDLENAITLYNKVLESASSESLAAKAQLQIGICYEKLGKTEAIKAYEIVLEKYSGQKEQAAAARARLAELKQEKPQGLSVTKLNFGSSEPFDIFPDGRRILGVEIRKGQNIVVYNLDTHKVKHITDHDWNNTGTWTYSPVLSADGKEIAYLESCGGKEGPCGNSLKVATLDGKSRVLLRSDKDYYYPNAWMPDGSAVLTILESGESDAPNQIGLVSREGGAFKKLASLKGGGGLDGGRSLACVSPDGKFVLFADSDPEEEKASDIYIINAGGGTAVPLIEHPAGDRYPRWSPDGTHVVFLSQRTGSWALWGVAVEDGKAAGDPFIIREGMKDDRLLNWTSHGLASWNWIAIRDIYFMDVNPITGEPVGKPKQLEYTPTGGNWVPVWSHDGKYFAFYREDDNSRKSYINVHYADGRSYKEFPIPKGYWRGYLRWLPDGTGIGMNSRDWDRENIIFKLSFNTEKWEEIPIPVDTVSEGWTRFEWSGNGKAFFYSKNGYADKGAGIYEHDMETGKDRLVYRNPNSRANFRWLKCSWDYKWLAFVESNNKVMVVNLDTGESHLAASDVGDPSWSPDGQRILAIRAYGGRKEHNKSLFLFPPSGGTVKEFKLSAPLPERGRLGALDWSPNGKQIIFQDRAGRSAVLLYNNLIPKGK